MHNLSLFIFLFLLFPLTFYVKLNYSIFVTTFFNQIEVLEVRKVNLDIALLDVHVEDHILPLLYMNLIAIGFVFIEKITQSYLFLELQFRIF